MNLFDIVADVLSKRSNGTLDQDPEFHKVFSSFMLVRYLSMRPSLIDAAEILNSVQGVLSPSQLYKLAYSIVPKQGSPFIKYISKRKSSSKKKTPESED